MSDLIDRQDAIDAIHEDADWLAAQGSDWQVERMERDKSILMSLPSAEKVQLSGEDATFDCISRQDAITAIFDLCGEVDTDNPHVDAIEEVLGNLPSASTDLSTFSDKLWKIAYERGRKEGRKKGKWIEQDAGGDGVFYECSVCKDAFTLIDGTPSDNNYNFCPNCGADMREGEEE